MYKYIYIHICIYIYIHINIISVLHEGLKLIVWDIGGAWRLPRCCRAN